MTDRYSVQEDHGSYTTSREVQEYDPWVGSQYTYAQGQSAHAATDTQSINDANCQEGMAAHDAHLNQSLAHPDTQDDQSMFSATSFDNTTPLGSLSSDNLWQAMNQNFVAHVGGSGETASGLSAGIPSTDSDTWMWNNNGHGGIHAVGPNGYFQEAFSSLPVESPGLYSTGFVPTLAGGGSSPQVPLRTSNDPPLASWQGPGNQPHATIEQEWQWYGDNPVGARQIALRVVEDAAPLYPDPGTSASALLREVDAEHPELRLELPVHPMYNEPGLPYTPAYPPHFPNNVEQSMEYDRAGERQQDEEQMPHPPSNDVDQGVPNSDLSAVVSTRVASSRVSVRCSLLLPDGSPCNQPFGASRLQYANRNLRRHQTSRIHNGTVYPCPHATCRSQDPYTRLEYLRKHLNKHCQYDACHDRGPFRSPGQLQRHLDEHLAGPSAQ